MPAPFTAQSALSGVQQLVSDFLATMREISPLPALRELGADLAELRAYCDSAGVDVDVAVHSGASQDTTRAVARWISTEIDEDLLDKTRSQGREVRAALEDSSGVLRAFPMSRPPAQKVARPRPPVLVCVAEDAAAQVPEERVPEELVEDRPLVVWIAAGQPPESFQRRQPRPPWVTVTLNPDTLGKDQLAAFLTRRGADFPLLMRTYSALYGLETAAEALKLIVEREQRSIRVKRGMAQQEASRLQQPSTSSGEAIAEMRFRLQRLFGEFEKTVQERMAEAVTPQIGTVTQRVEERLNAIVDLERITREKSIELRVLQRDERDILGMVRDSLRDRMGADLDSWRELLALVTADVDHAVGDFGGPPIVVRHHDLPDTRLQRVIDSSVRFDRAYRGEMPKHGVPEYLQQARKYQGFLGTLFPIIGLTAWKSPQIAAFASIGLLIVGSLGVPGAIRRERAETVAREIERARDTLRAEIRRMFAEVERGWFSAVGDALREEQSRVAIQFESAMREAQLRRNETVQEDRRRLQRQLQALENTDRQLAAARRGRDASVNSAAQLRGALRQLGVAAGAAAAGAAAKESSV